MPILNYTTSIAVEKTLGEIHRILAKRGAKSILTDYDSEGEPMAVSFLVRTPYGDRSFRLPANVVAVQKVLVKQYGEGRVERKATSLEQAARVAWRIVKDWLEAQMAIIEADMVTLDQVFLPYMTDERGQTVYQIMVEQHLALPSGKGNGDDFDG